MKRLIEKHFVKKNITKNHMLSLGFRFNPHIFNDEANYYSYKFPVYEYKNHSLIECAIEVDAETGNVLLNVNNVGKKTSFIPFYQNMYGNYEPILKIINKAILNEFKKLGIEEVKEEE